MKYLSKDEMNGLTTKRLLAYKKKQLSNAFHPMCRKQDFRCNSGCDNCEFDKEADEYELAFLTCKKILSEREHVK